jgi:hypothetical protein
VRRAAKIDDNQPEIVDALLAIGCSVQSLAAVGKGCPDLLVGLAGRNYLLEIKSEAGQFTRDQKAWHATWNGPAHIVRSITEAIKIVTAHGRVPRSER